MKRLQELRYHDVYEPFSANSEAKTVQVRQDRTRHETVKIPALPQTHRVTTTKHLTAPVSHKSKSSINLAPPLEFLQPKAFKKSKLQFKPSFKEISELATVILSLPSKIDYLSRVLYLPRPPGSDKKKTLVLDLDETLTHAVKNIDSAHLRLKISENVTIGVNLRPFLHDFLRFASQEFELVVFTASIKRYADAILDHLDPKGTLIAHRLYREHCYMFRSFFIKDIRILGHREIRDIAIIDNSLVSFSLQVENGIPISSWTEDLNDSALFDLVGYLKVLKGVRDVRSLNRSTFNICSHINGVRS